MKKFISVIFILTLMTPLFAEDFTLKKSSNAKSVFNLLQFTGINLVNIDTVISYNLIWNSKGRIKEANPFWRGFQKSPPLDFAVTYIINTGIVLGSSWLYKKNRFLAYAFIALVNIIEIYCVYSNIKLWNKLM